MKKKLIYRLLLLGCALILCCANTISAQNRGTSISAAIIDELGNPVSGVNIYAPKGAVAITDEEGKFEIKVPAKSSLVVEKDGFDSKVLTISDLTEEIVMVRSQFLASSKDQVKMGISTKSRREMVGSTSIINPADRLAYDNTQWVKDYIQGLLPGVKGSDNVRGLGGALFVIDGVIGRDPDILNMDEVDQITVLKDANAIALYGAQGKNGVIIINTKRGKINRRDANVNVRYGFKDPISMPKYLGSADYMELYNEARANDGFDQYYDDELIEDTRRLVNPYKFPDVDLYSSEYMRSMAQTVDVVTEFSGGNEKTRYYVNMGYTRNQSLVSLNSDANAGTNRFNVRGNIDFRVNNFIKSSVDAVAIISTNKMAHTNLLNEGASLKPNAYAPLLPISMMDTTGNPTLAGQIDAAGKYGGMLLGSSQVYQGDAPIANVIAGGYRNQMFRSTQFNNSIDFDLDMIAEGLSARTYLSFDFYDGYNVSVTNKYRVYEPTWDGNSIVGLTPYGDVDLKDLTESVSTRDYISRLGFYGLINYDKSINDKHNINATLMGYTNSTSRDDVLQTDRSSHAGLQLSYDYKKKIFADFSGAYIHSIKLPEGNRGGFSPTGGLAYIISEEDFMDNIGFIDFLKLKATAGVIKSDLGISNTYTQGGQEVTEEYYLYSETYSDGSWFNWNDGGQSNREKDISQGANNLMAFEERFDMNLGFESLLFKSLFMEFNFFNTEINKQLTTLNNRYPSYYNAFRPYDNYNEDFYSGFELGMNLNEKINDFHIDLGGNLMYVRTEVTKRDEIHENSYQYNRGRPVNTIYGLMDDGLYQIADFSTDADGNFVLKEGLPVPAFGAVQPGDVKYIDQNNDGVVNDNDRSHIGQWSNPWSYGLNMKLSYKGFSLFVLGIGQFGGEAMMKDNGNESYYWIDGNDKYSEIALDRWTPEKGWQATYPRLSSQTNNNNYRNSTFWMYANNFFDIERAQLTYEFSKKFCDKLKMKNLSVNVAGTNLIRFAENKDVQQLNTIGNPQFRHFTLGLRTSF